MLIKKYKRKKDIRSINHTVKTQKLHSEHNAPTSFGSSRTTDIVLSLCLPKVHSNSMLPDVREFYYKHTFTYFFIINTNAITTHDSNVSRASMTHATRAPPLPPFKWHLNIFIMRISL